MVCPTLPNGGSARVLACAAARLSRAVSVPFSCLQIAALSMPAGMTAWPACTAPVTCNPHPSHQACTCSLERTCSSSCHATCRHTIWLEPAGWNARTPLAFIGPPAALNVPAQWALQDVSSASVRPPRTDQVVDPAVCSMGPPIAPFSPDAGMSQYLLIACMAIVCLPLRVSLLRGHVRLAFFLLRKVPQTSCGSLTCRLNHRPHCAWACEAYIGREPNQPLALTSIQLAEAVVKDFITSPPPLMPGLKHDVDLLDSCPDPMELSGEPQDFSAIPAASSRNVNIFGGCPCRVCPLPHWRSLQIQSTQTRPL